MSRFNKKIIVTSFASNVARMDTIFYCAGKIGRQNGSASTMMTRSTPYSPALASNPLSVPGWSSVSRTRLFRMAESGLRMRMDGGRRGWVHNPDSPPFMYYFGSNRNQHHNIYPVLFLARLALRMIEAIMEMKRIVATTTSGPQDGISISDSSIQCAASIFEPINTSTKASPYLR